MSEREHTVSGMSVIAAMAKFFLSILPAVLTYATKLEAKNEKVRRITRGDGPASPLGHGPDK